MNENINKSEQNQNLLKKFVLYGGIFLAGLFIVIFNQVFDVQNESQNNNKNNPNPTQNKTEENETLKKLSDINDKFYSMNIHLVLDDDAITLEYQKVDTIEVGMKKYHKEQTEYIKAENTYYIMENNNFIKNDEFIDFNFDKTFIDLTNIKDLLRCTGEYAKNTNGIYNTLEYTYSLKDIIKIYNNYNNASVIITGKGEIKLTAYYKDETLNYIEIDATDLYNLIENKNLNQVKYKIEVQAEKEEDPSWILEKLS